MKKVTACLVFATLLLFVPSLFGQTVVPMSFNGDYWGNLWTYNNETVATGFYGGTINNVQVGQNDQSPGMICDDYKDNITTGETWNATAINASTISANLGSLLFGSNNPGNNIGVQGYTEVAYLVYQMFTTSPSGVDQAAYSEAIWALTKGIPVSALGNCSLSNPSLACSYYNEALNKWSTMTSSELATLWIYTPSPKGNGEAQEMWGMVAVPEGGSALAYLLIAAICCFTAISHSRKPLPLTR